MTTFKIGKIHSILFVKFAQTSLRVMVTKICLCVYEAPLFLINPISHSTHSMAVVKYDCICNNNLPHVSKALYQTST